MTGMRFAVTLVVVGAILSVVAAPGGAEEQPVRLYAAGSLRPALTEVIAAFEKTRGMKVEATFGASGLLRERLAGGEAADVFASADMGQPQTLQEAGKAGPVVLFARNRLCALVRPDLAVKPDNLLSVMLDPSIRLATSTPKADPAGDYAWEVFRKADAVRPGSRERLETKALKLTGSPGTPPAPAGRNVVAWHLGERRADLFLGYCTSAKALKTELPGAQAMELPPDLAVRADYGLTILEGTAAPRAAAALAFYILSNDGQGILRRHGFDAPLLNSD